jgi:membrane protein DedA with SNARE-associated domain
VAEWATRVLSGGGPVGLALIMLLENLFPPIPSEVVLPFAGFLVGAGNLALVPAFAAATAGSTAGALVLYALGRYGGRPLLLRWHKVLRLDEDDLDRADDWFDRHGWAAVVLGRMVPFVRSVISIPAGTSEMPVGRFLALTALGSGIWNALLIGAGMLLGERHAQVSALVSRFTPLLFAALALGLLAWWWRRRRPA